MAFTVSNLTDYVKQNPKVDIEGIVLNLESVNMGLSVQDGIKYSEKLLVVDGGEAIIQDGSYVSSSANGSFELSDKALTVVERHVKESFDPQSLNRKVASVVMSAGSDVEDLPAFVKDAIIKTKVDSIKRKNEQSLWLGDSSVTGSAAAVRHLEDFDGYVKLAQDSTDTIKTAAAAVALTAANAEARVAEMIALIPEDLIMEETDLFMSPSAFVTYRAVMVEKYKTAQTFGDSIKFQTSYQIPGTNCTAHAVTGLVGSNDMILAKASNLYIGCDLKSEEEEAEMRKLEDRSFEFFALYKLGAQLGKEDEIVVTLASV